MPFPIAAIPSTCGHGVGSRMTSYGRPNGGYGIHEEPDAAASPTDPARRWVHVRYLRLPQAVRNDVRSTLLAWFAKKIRILRLSKPSPIKRNWTATCINR